MKEKALAKFADNRARITDDTKEELTFPLHYFNKLEEFKTVVNSLKTEFNELIGNTRIMFAVKKQSSIGNMLVKNKELSSNLNTTQIGQKCNAPGCRKCPLVSPENRFMINGITLTTPK